MKVLIIGAAGMLGRKLAEKLAQSRQLSGEPITHLTQVDVVEPITPEGSDFPVENQACDFSKTDNARRLISQKPDVIFHLAAIVSGEAEADFGKGYAINLDGTRHLLDSIAAEDGYCPRFVFASSLAVFGTPFPDTIPDDFHQAPLTSYGTQKAIGELLLSDYSRKDLLDGVALRLPTIVVRPGKPNAAASSFFSSIIREPLNGQEAILPVPENVVHWMASPKAATRYFVHAAEMNTSAISGSRAFTMPGLAVSVSEQIETLRKIGGQACVDLIKRLPNPMVEKIVLGWPERFDAKRALSVGFQPDTSFEAIVRDYVESEGISI